MEPSLPHHYSEHEREGEAGQTATKKKQQGLSSPPPLAEYRQTRALMLERDAYPDDNRHELFLLGDGEKKITFVEDSRTFLYSSSFFICLALPPPHFPHQSLHMLAFA
jgi:hypothetical protein